MGAVFLWFQSILVKKVANLSIDHLFDLIWELLVNKWT